MSGKRRNSRLTQNGKTITCTVDNSVLLVVSRLSSYSSSILSSTSRSKDQSNYFRKLWTLLDPVTTNWQACTRETDADRSWQAGHGETVNQQTRWTRKMQRKAFLFGYSPSQSIWRTWRRMCSHIPLKERTQIRKVMLQKWRHTNGSTEVMLISAKTKIDLFCEQTSMVTWKQQSTKVSTKDVIFGTITDTLPWYKFSMESVPNPNFTRHGEELRKFQKPSQKPRVFHTYNLLNFDKSCEELPWNHRTTTLHRSETSGIAERAVRRIKEET